MKELRDHLTVWLKGCEPAINFILTAHEIVETWDDLVDQDQEVPPNKASEVFYAALITLPRNQFYLANFALLNPVFEGAILDWLTANAMEKRKSGNDLKQAFVLRSGVLLLTAMSARIIGGLEWAAKVNLEFRSLSEAWPDYQKEHGGRDGMG